jgi:hypothetical protein
MSIRDVLSNAALFALHASREPRWPVSRTTFVSELEDDPPDLAASVP